MQSKTGTLNCRTPGPSHPDFPTTLHISLRLVALAALALLPASARAQDAVWVGGTSANWSDSANWNPITVPGSTGLATFDATSANTTISLGAGVTVDSILFDASAAAYTIGAGAVGSEVLTLDTAGGILMSSSVANHQLVNAAIVLGIDGTVSTFGFSNSSATHTLTLAGGITAAAFAGTKTVQFFGAGAVTVDGVIANGTSGVVALAKSDAGVLTLNGNNSYTGGTSLTAAYHVAAGHDSAFGTGAINLASSAGTIRAATAAPRTIANAITMSSSTTFGSTGTGNLLFTGAVNSGAASKTFTVNNAVTEFSGVISGASTTNTLTKTGPGTLVFSGANTSTKRVAITQGTLRLDYSTQNNNKIVGVLSMTGGTLELAGGSFVDAVVSFTNSSNVFNTITRSSGTSVLELNAITIGVSPFLLNFTDNGIATTDTLNTNGILGRWARVTVGGVANFAMNSTNGANGPITAYTAYTDIFRLGPNAVPNTPAANVRIIDGGTSGNIPLAASPTTQINTLRMTATGGPAMIAPLAPTDIFSVGNEAGGAIWQGAGAGQLTIGTLVDDGIITSGDTSGTPVSTRLQLINDNPTTPMIINSSVNDNGLETIGIIKLGVGEVILNGTNTYTVNNTSAGTVNLVAEGTLTLTGNRTADHARIEISPANVNATLNIQNGTFNITGDIRAGNNDTLNTGTVNQTGGVITTTATTSMAQTCLGSGTSTGVYNLSGGSLIGAAAADRGILIGTNSESTGIFNLSGTGVLNMGVSNVQIVRSDATVSNITGTFSQTGGTATINTLDMAGRSSSATNCQAFLTLSGGTMTVNSFNFLSNGTNCVSTISISGTADVTLPEFPATRGTGSTATIAFNGGMLTPLAASANYISNMTSATVTATGATFNVPSGRDITIPQVLSNASGHVGTVTKTGAGALTLSGANTYTGVTTVSNGILSVTGSLAGDVVVTNAAELRGTGTIAGGVAIGSTATIRPGTSPGVLTINGLADLSGGAVHVFEIDNAGPAATGSNDGSSTNSGSSRIAIGAGGSFEATQYKVRVVESGSFALSFNPASAYSWTLVSSNLIDLGGIPLTTIDLNATDAPTLFAAVPGSGTLTIDTTVNQVNLNYTPIPEPRLLLLGLAGLAMIRRRGP